MLACLAAVKSLACKQDACGDGSTAEEEE